MPQANALGGPNDGQAERVVVARAHVRDRMGGSRRRGGGRLAERVSMIEER
jgi:hypothetical protein